MDHSFAVFDKKLALAIVNPWSDPGYPATKQALSKMWTVLERGIPKLSINI